tara:strand:+ start:68 stop:517 length:450 start_codon:yes stop_codon:yes gene_type:complete
MTYSKVYENQQDKKNEEKLAELLAKKFKCEMLPEPKFSYFDYVAHRNKRPVAMIEMRKRSHEYSKYPTIMMPLQKLTAYHAVKGIMNLPCYFVVQWKDYVGYADFDDFIIEADYRISEISHNRRGDLRQEIVSHLPKEKVKLIYEGDLI